MTLFQLLRRELRQMFRLDPRRALYLFGASITYALLFGMLYANHVVNAIPLALYDEDQSQLSRRVIQAFEDSEKFRVVAQVTSQEELDAALREKEAAVALTIPANFAKDVKFGHSPALLLTANASNIAIVNTVTSAAQEIIGGFVAQTGVVAVESAGLPPAAALAKAAPLDLRVRILHNPTLSYLNFFVLGLALTAWQQGLFLAIGAGLIYDLAERTEIAGVPAWKLLSAKLLLYWLCGMVALALTLAVAVPLFDIPWRGSFWTLALLGGAFAFAALAAAGLIAVLCGNEVAFTQSSLVCSISSFIFSGYIWPPHGMLSPGLLLSHAFPLTYFAPAVRELALAGYTPDLSAKFGALLLLGLLFGSTALWRLSVARNRAPQSSVSRAA